jgi:NAD(P)H-hydrate epimerase
MQLYSAQEIMAADRWAIEDLGIPGAVLMETAGRHCAEVFDETFSANFPGPVLVVCGKGNNGGDGYVIARLLGERGWQVSTCILAAEEEISGDAAVMLQVLQRLHPQSLCFVGSVAALDPCFLSAPPLIVDAIFGTGLKSDVRGLQAEAIARINAATAAVLAVDIPSGVDGSTGRICGAAVQARVTVTFDGVKVGHASQPGAAMTGELHVADIGIPHSGRPQGKGQVRAIEALDAARLLPLRPANGHKGSFGHLLLVGGSTGKTGAVALAGEAAVRSGCGLVTVGVAQQLHDIIEVKLTEAMSVPLAATDGFLRREAAAQICELAAQRQALAFGPGLGVTAELRQLLGEVLHSLEVPAVIDADGLNLLAGQLDLLHTRRSEQLVLTPHPGELARLCGSSVSEIEANRFEIARSFAREHGVVLLLKGARTLIAAPDGRVNINSTGNAGLATGGSGDVLTGLLGGLLAQGLDAFAAATLAAWLHGRAAELVSDELGCAGLAASDLLLKLPQARKELILCDTWKGDSLC